MLKKFLGKNYNRFGGCVKLGTGEYVVTTDGVGTKALLASDYTSIGYDVVNHCVNDILCEQAFPLAFTNYIGMPKKDETQYANLIKGMTDACTQNNCTLVGGETAIMGDIYKDKALSVVGTMIGKRMYSSGRLKAGDIIFGLPSSGLHTNGYTIARKFFEDRMNEPIGNSTIRETLLIPHKSYLNFFYHLYDKYITVKAATHVTGGGWQNLYRTISCDIDFEIQLSYSIPKIFKKLYKNRTPQFMFSEFNMGIGMFIFIDRNQVNALHETLHPQSYLILGEVLPGNGEVRIENQTLLRESY